MPLLIRPVVAADTEILAALVVDSDLYQKRELEQAKIDPEVVRSSKAEWVEQILAKPDWQYLVAEDEGLAGYVLVEKNETYPGTGSINDLFVRPDRRRQGIARRLLTAGLEWLRRAGVKEVTIAVHSRNQAALNLYEAAGFEPQADEYRYLTRSL